MPTLILRQLAATDPTAAEIVGIIDSGLEDDAKLAQVVELIRKHPALEQANEIAKQWSQEAIDAIAILPESSVKNALKVFAAAVVERNE
jgi:heptaprenyl diphosphate synthase